MYGDLTKEGEISWSLQQIIDLQGEKGWMRSYIRLQVQSFESTLME